VLLGRNRVGKTTLLKSLIWAVPIQDGHDRAMVIDSRPPYERARAGIGFVPPGA
jgi:ABC-type branched-subunit amino acid transport system ATPase component